MKRRHVVHHRGPLTYWAAMCALTRKKGGFTSTEVFEATGIGVRNTVVCYVRACVRAGHVSVIGTRPSERRAYSEHKLYAVNANAPSKAPFEKPNAQARQGAVHQQIWTAMRAMPLFTTRELAATASTDEFEVSHLVARIYCWRLIRGGYLQMVGKAGRWKVMRLRPGMNTGPDMPLIKASGEIIDRNPGARRRRAP